MQSSGSSFLRRRLTTISTARVYSSASCPRSWLRMSSRLKHLARLPGQQVQQVEFGARQLQRPPPGATRCGGLHQCSGLRNSNVAPRPRSRARWPASAAQHGLQPSHQFTRLKGLGQVVIGSQLQPHHPVHHLAPGRSASRWADRPACEWCGTAQNPSISGSMTSRMAASNPPAHQLGEPVARFEGMDQLQLEPLEVGGQWRARAARRRQ